MHKHKDIKITFFRGGIKNTTNPEYIDLLDALDLIGSNTYRDKITKLREMTPENYKEVKKGLDYFVFSAICGTRKGDQVKELSGLINGDIDGLESLEKAIQVRDQLSQDQHILAAWVSPSGKGVKFLTYYDIPDDIGSDPDGLNGYFRDAWYIMASYFSRKG